MCSALNCGKVEASSNFFTPAFLILLLEVIKLSI